MVSFLINVNFIVFNEHVFLNGGLPNIVVNLVTLLNSEYC